MSTDVQTEHFLAQKIKQLRKQSGFTLQQLSQKSGISVSTLSKIEKGQLSPTYEKIVALAHGFGIHVAELFYEERHSTPNGRLAVTCAGDTLVHSTEQYDYRPLCSELTRKQFVPLLTTVKARDIKAFPALLQHEGEEFIYVLSGEITIHTDFYQPVTLFPGDSCYFDSTMNHACVAGEEEAQILWVCSQTVINPN